ncbi:hypothetical protein Bca52824_023685 [Brassica carinata]|uniref:Nodulin homeobox N-terminal domain-containing protein n=1 Tax=Brassica carinata TaxID=52824 RepID=A0A8X8AUW9_BRACI|nr:hypothetical protein Bca52824_023685 [Brassica carinata]
MNSLYLIDDHSFLLLAKHLIPAVNGLHWRDSREIHKLLNDNKDFCIYYHNGKKISVEKLAGALPVHLLAAIKAHDRDENFENMLSGIRLLHTLCELTSRHSKLDQVLLDDVVLSAKMVDLVIYTMVALGGSRKESWKSDNDSLVEATMVASTLHLLHGFISPEFQDIVFVLLAHSKVDLFIEAAFGAVHNVVRSLTAKLLYHRTDHLPKSLGANPLGGANFHCQQAEAALQFLHSLCQEKLFSERVAKNKELCGKGGLLMLAESILSLAVSPGFVREARTVASMNRTKAKVLSLLHHIFEAENVSFLDEVERAGNLHLAQPIASEVLELLKLSLFGSPNDSDSPDYPMSFLLLNAMLLADVFSDDSNFRCFYTDHFSMILSTVFCLSHEEFVSMLCSSALSSREEEATVDYDLFRSAGCVLSAFSSSGIWNVPQFKLNFQNNLTMSSYTHQRTSLLVKIIAKLHCFSPGICTGSLLRHAEYLIASALDVKDLMMVFCNHLQPLIRSQFEGSQASVKQRKEPLNLNIERASDGAARKNDVNENVEIVPRLKESGADARNIETSGLDTRSKRGKSLVEEGELAQDFTKLFKGSGSGEGNIMSDDQMEMMEKAIADEPFMHLLIMRFCRVPGLQLCS